MVDSGKTLALGLLTLCVNIVLTIVKITVGLVGNSYALVADGIESAGDILSSLITWTGFHFSLRPPDDNHPFGHGKVESLAGLFSGAALLVAAGIIAWNAVHEIITPHHAPAWFTLPVLLGVVVIKSLLARHIFRISGELDSLALQGDAWHHRADAITSTAAAIGITIALIGGKGWESADDYAALVACVVIVFNGSHIVRNALHEVLDGNVPDELTEEIRRLSAQVDGVRGIDKCRIRKSGIRIFIDIHVRVDAERTVREGHTIGHDVKNHLCKINPRIADVSVHIEPAD